MDLITLTLAKNYTDSVAISGGGTSVTTSTTNGNIKINGAESVVYTHPSGTNPHNTTKTDIGLSNVDNTSDINKPVSTNQANAISLKVDKVAGSSLIPDVTLANLNSHKSSTNNPHSTSLLQLSDINIVNPTEGQKIAYDASTSKWINTSSTVGADEKVKATSTSMASKYLDELIDNDTITMVGDKLIVNSVSGVTKSELLTLVGMDTNIKATLNALASAGMIFKGVKNTKAELDAVVGMLLGELYIIKVDETQGNLKTSYIYDGTDWLSLGESNVNVRDFTIDKLDLTSEVKNILPKANMDLTGIVTSTDLANYTTTTDLSTNYALKTDLTEKANTLDVYTKVDSDGKFVEKVTEKSLVADTEIARLTGISTGANKVADSTINGNILIDNVETKVYTHPTTHPPSIIVQDANNRFVTDVEKSTWNGKATQSTIDSSINKIEIGGRNLLLGSDFTSPKDWVLYNNDDYSAGIFGCSETDYRRDIPNKQIYIWGKCSGTSTEQGNANFYQELSANVVAQLKGGATLIYSQNASQSSNVGVTLKLQGWDSASNSLFYKEFNVGKAITLEPFASVTRIRLTVHVYALNTTKDSVFLLYIDNCKLETGNKATGWTPSPEDMAYKITNGITSARPIPTHIGQTHFDTTLGKPIWCKTISPIDWVDSMGTVV